MPLCNIVILFAQLLGWKVSRFVEFYFCAFFIPSHFAGCASRFSTAAFRQSIVSVSLLWVYPAYLLLAFWMLFSFLYRTLKGLSYGIWSSGSMWSFQMKMYFAVFTICHLYVEHLPWFVGWLFRQATLSLNDDKNSLTRVG